MSEFASRIGLGCSRLAGGVAERSSRQLVDAALGCGIRYFDTAPSYGGGRSEEVLGRALGGMRADVRVCTKVGLPRPSPTLKMEFRNALVGTLRRAAPQSVVKRLRKVAAPARAGAERHYGRFDMSFVRESLEQSMTALRSEHLDAVMLHEPRLSDPPADTRAMLERMRAGRIIGELGTGSAQGSADLPSFGRLAQCAVQASLPADGREWIMHGLMRDFDPLALQDAVARSGLSDALPLLRNFSLAGERGASLWICAVLLGASPSRVLVSTHSPQRLETLVKEGGDLFGELGVHMGEDVTSSWALLVREYLAGRGGGS